MKGEGREREKGKEVKERRGKEKRWNKERIEERGEKGKGEEI